MPVVVETAALVMGNSSSGSTGGNNRPRFRNGWLEAVAVANSAENAEATDNFMVTDQGVGRNKNCQKSAKKAGGKKRGVER